MADPLTAAKDAAGQALSRGLADPLVLEAAQLLVLAVDAPKILTKLVVMYNGHHGLVASTWLDLEDHEEAARQVHEAMRQQRELIDGHNSQTNAAASSPGAASSSSSNSSSSSIQPVLHEHAIQASHVEYLRQPLDTLKSYVDAALAEIAKATDKQSRSHFVLKDTQDLQSAQRMLRAFTSAIEQNQNRVMVMGDTGAGKSTLLNRLLGCHLLPSKSVSSTGVLCEVHGSPDDKPHLYMCALPDKAARMLNDPRKLNTTNMRQIIFDTETDFKLVEEVEQPLLECFERLQAGDFTADPSEVLAPYLLRHVTPFYARADGSPQWFRARVQWPCSLLSSGLVLVDSPGFNDDLFLDELVLTEATMCSSFIGVLKSGFTNSFGSCLALLKQVDLNRRAMFFVLTKVDVPAQMASDEDRTRAIGHALIQLDTHFDGWDQRFWAPVNAQDSMQRFVSQQPDSLEYAALTRSLDSYLAESMGFRLERSLGVLESVYNSLYEHHVLCEIFASMDAARRERELKALQVEHDQLQSQRLLVLEKVDVLVKAKASELALNLEVYISSQDFRDDVATSLKRYKSQPVPLWDIRSKIGFQIEKANQIAERELRCCLSRFLAERLVELSAGVQAIISNQQQDSASHEEESQRLKQLMDQRRNQLEKEFITARVPTLKPFQLPKSISNDRIDTEILRSYIMGLHLEAHAELPPALEHADSHDGTAEGTEVAASAQMAANSNSDAEAEDAIPSKAGGDKIVLRSGGVLSRQAEAIAQMSYKAGIGAVSALLQQMQPSPSQSSNPFMFLETVVELQLTQLAAAAPLAAQEAMQLSHLSPQSILKDELSRVNQHLRDKELKHEAAQKAAYAGVEKNQEFHKQQMELLSKTVGRQLRNQVALHIKRWSLSRDEVDVPSHAIMLGKGTFGRVMAGELLLQAQAGAMSGAVPSRVPVAVKYLEFACDDLVDYSSLHSEAELLRRVNHTNVIKLYGAFLNHDKQVGLVMERAVCSLEDIIYVQQQQQGAATATPIAFPDPAHQRAQALLSRHPTLDLRDSSNVLHILLQVAQGMACVREHNVIHRDVKAGNILFNDAGMVKLSDFGSARFANQVTGTLIGSPMVCAPEVMLRKWYGPPVDVYSFAFLAWRLVHALTCPFRSLELALKESIAVSQVRAAHPALALGGAEFARAVTLAAAALDASQVNHALEQSNAALQARPAFTHTHSFEVQGRPVHLNALIAECWAVEPERRPEWTDIILQLSGHNFALSGRRSKVKSREGSRSRRLERSRNYYGIISFDGGGSRGIVCAVILEELEKRLGYSLVDHTPRLLLAGTSTGGLISLAMTYKRWGGGKLVDFYVDMAKVVFNRWGITQLWSTIWNGARYDATALEQLLKEVFGDERMTPPIAAAAAAAAHEAIEDIAALHTSMGSLSLIQASRQPLGFWPRIPHSKSEGDTPELSPAPTASTPVEPQPFCFVVTNRADHKAGAYLLRNYEALGPASYSGQSGMPVWQAGRATSAADTYFTAFEPHQGQANAPARVFTDGGMGWNNPTALAMWEAIALADSTGSSRKSSGSQDSDSGVGSPDPDATATTQKKAAAVATPAAAPNSASSASASSSASPVASVRDTPSVDTGLSSDPVPIRFILSLGTGSHVDPRSLLAPSRNLLRLSDAKNALVQHATDCEVVHRQVMRDCARHSVPYFRLNPTLPRDFALDVSDAEQLKQLANITRNYIKGEGKDIFEAVVRVVKESHTPVLKRSTSATRLSPQGPVTSAVSSK